MLSRFAGVSLENLLIDMYVLETRRGLLVGPRFLWVKYDGVKEGFYGLIMTGQRRDLLAIMRYSRDFKNRGLGKVGVE